MKTKYKAMKINGRKYDEHRVLMNNAIGRKLAFNEVVHHIDGDKSNNSLNNLEIMSRSDHSTLHMKGRVTPQSSKNALSVRGREIRSAAKITLDQVKAIRERITNGETGTQIAKDFGVTKNTVSRIKCGECWSWL